MEMPIDIINKHASPAFGLVGGDGLTTGQRNLNIDLELQRKFVIIPREEIAAVEIEMDGDTISAGSGPEACHAGLSENPAWLFNHAVHCLALYQYLADREKLVEEQARIEANRQIIINRRPEPGVYILNTGGEIHLTVVTAERNIIFGKRGQHDTLDVTDVYDGLENRSQWVFTPVQTGLSA